MITIGKINKLEWVRFNHDEPLSQLELLNEFKLFAILFPDDKEKTRFVNITDEVKEFYGVIELTEELVELAEKQLHGVEIAIYFDEEEEEYRSVFKLYGKPRFAYTLLCESSLLRPKNRPGMVCLPLIGEVSDIQLLHDLNQETTKLIQEEENHLLETTSSFQSLIKKFIRKCKEEDD